MNYFMKPKTCKSCKQKFTPVRPLQSCCNIPCAIAHANNLKEKNKRLEELKTRKAYIDTKNKLKSLTELANEAQTYVNRYVRMRDKHLGCISCDKPASWNGQWHASHYKSRGANSALRFNLWNLNKSCSVCNNYLSGNIGDYREGLIDKIGIDKVNILDRHEKSKRYDREYLIRMKKVFMRMCKRFD